MHTYARTYRTRTRRFYRLGGSCGSSFRAACLFDREGFTSWSRSRRALISRARVASCNRGRFLVTFKQMRVHDAPVPERDLSENPESLEIPLCIVCHHFPHVFTLLSSWNVAARDARHETVSVGSSARSRDQLRSFALPLLPFSPLHVGASLVRTYRGFTSYGRVAPSKVFFADTESVAS